ncbi:hypothetical protein [Daejeonella sp. H1SJ63]|uniref:hypothetical protein n=1 Tax=Daejeonella sp. H1SJ63 TaxID=3034145 RepID=UPI0023EDE636|nr:hypothetical protein [Daejeonella sp. H1SJ63]
MTKNAHLNKIGFEKIMIWENLSPLETLKSEVSQLIGLANAVADEYEKLNIGKFTQGVYDDIVGNGIANIRGKYIDATKAEIERLKVSNPTVKNALLERIDIDLNNLDDSIVE